MAAITPAVRRFNSVPAGLLDCPADQLAKFLESPTLLYLQGQRDPPLFISVLLHGNEISGWNGLRSLLKETNPLPRSLIIFIGNVDAAAANLRTLPHQQDYNRIWRNAQDPEALLAESVRRAIHEQALFAAVDLHNNTGHNPHYSVLTDITPENLGLAYLFSDKAVLVREPDTTLAPVFDQHCPAVTLELGPVGDHNCELRCHDYLQQCLTLDRVPVARLEDMSMYRSLVRVHVQESAAFSFADEESLTPLILTGGMEAVNFHELPIGTEFGVARLQLNSVLRVLDVAHNDVTHNFFDVVDGRILLKRSVTPAMYTTDPLVIRQDCLCYFMEPLD